jgi:hypothetical protein
MPHSLCKILLNANHGPNIYKDTKPLMSAFLKNWPVKLLGGRCLSVWGPRSPKVRGALVHKRGRIYQHDWLYLQSVNSIKTPVKTTFRVWCLYRYLVPDANLLLGTVHGLAFWFDVAFIGANATVWLSTAPTQPLTHWYQVRPHNPS